MIEQINKMARARVRKPVNGEFRGKDPAEANDEGRVWQRRLLSLERGLRTEEEALDLEREKIKSPELGAAARRLKSLQEGRPPSEARSRAALLAGLPRLETAGSGRVIREFNADLALLTKLRKIDREDAQVDNVRSLHFEFRVEKLVKQANFKQTECFAPDERRFHFLTTTKASEAQRSVKSSVNLPASKHARAKTSSSLRPWRLEGGAKLGSGFVRRLLQLTESQLQSCKSETGAAALERQSSANDYSVLFSRETLNDL